ncbi:helix-turn-helix domain-containing protein [Bifidobacterium dentium]|uniref:helix-turn-helix domain-containing protein n=1 Tax=Bifidobacterium dentium TaxID=1689 RepID=UPI0018B060BF|nr:helix-turn-helix domain-containing protein [Bifidobacterium dentium]
MSFQALSWAYGLSLGSAPQKAVLLYLAQFAHEDGTCTWPSVINIQVATELGERAVRKALRDLQAKGLIVPGDQRHAALGKGGGTVPRGRRSKVWDLRLNMPVESFDGVERAEDVRDRLREEERERRACERERRRGKEHGTAARGGPEDPSGAASEPAETEGCTTCTPRNTAQGCTTCTSETDEGCTTCTSRGAPRAPNRLIQTNNPSLPTGELPASGKRPSGTESGGRDGGNAEALAVTDRLASVRAGLSLTTAAPAGRDLDRIARLVGRVAGASGSGRTAALALVLAVVDWLPGNTFWLRRVDSARRLADNWDGIANDYAVDRIEETRRRDKETRDRDRPAATKPAAVPSSHAERHVHSMLCEHVLADMRPHEGEYDHEGSLRYGRPSEWQTACMRRADELNRRDGIEVAA